MNKQRVTDGEDRTLAYRDWRRNFGDGCYACDVDQVEYRLVDGQVKPVAILELTRADSFGDNTKALRDSILKRITVRDLQGKFLRRVAHELNVKAYIVLFVKDLSEFKVFNVSDGGEWCTFTNSEYRHWIKSL